MELATIIVLLLIVCGLCWYANKLNDKLEYYAESNRRQAELRVKVETDIDYWKKEALDNANALAEAQEKNKEIVSQRKSSETRLGQTTEHLLPFLEQFQHDVKDVRFLGSPIDLIAFDFEKPSITFIEVKTNNAKESKRQKIIKNAIKAGHVYYEKMTLNTKGLKIKKEENEV